MIKCNCCLVEKEVSEFSPQKTNPKKLYSWCDDCRRKQKRPERRYNLRTEYAEMRAKGIAMRKFDDKQAAELHRRHTVDKVSYKQLATETGVSITTIGNTIRRASANL